LLEQKFLSCVEELVQSANNYWLVGRVFFPFLNNEIGVFDLDYSTSFIQPGLVHCPRFTPNEDNYLHIEWLECANLEKSITMESSVQVEFLNAQKPLVTFLAWDRNNPNPSSFFSLSAWESKFYMDCAAEDFYVNGSQPMLDVNIVPPALQQAAQMMFNAKARKLDLSTTPAATKLNRIAQEARKSAAAKQDPIKHLEQDGSWPMCKFCSYKSYAMYAALPNKKAKTCFKHRNINDFSYCSQLFNYFSSNPQKLSNFQLDEKDNNQVETLQPLLRKRGRS
jgi:hypothetical protein